jgi:hypothetical protein
MAILRKGDLLGICVHHSVYKPANNLTELKAQATLFNGWHKSKSWAETTKTDSAYPYISYHYLLATDGSLLNTTDEKYVKYHAGDNFRGELSFNLHGLGVCLTGNYETDKPTDAQMKTLVNLIRDVEKRYKINARIRGHKETSQDPTACPGKNLGTSTSGWLKQVITNVNDPNYPPAPVEPPKPPELIECEKQVIELKAQISALNEGLRASQASEKMAVERAEFLESTLAIRDRELKDLEVDYDRVLKERNRFENDYLEAVKKLKECEDGSWFAQLRDRIYELWNEYKERIIKFLKRE